LTETIPGFGGTQQSSYWGDSDQRIAARRMAGLVLPDVLRATERLKLFDCCRQFAAKESRPISGTGAFAVI
jgi:hypothetical protein